MIEARLREIVATVGTIRLDLNEGKLDDARARALDLEALAVDLIVELDEGTG